MRFSPRPRNIRRVRKFTWEAGLEYLVNGAGDLETRQSSGRFNTEFENSDQFTVEANDTYEMLVDPFTPVPGAIVRPGSYDFQDVTVVVHDGTAAAGVGHRVGAAGRLLRWRHHDGRLQQRPRDADQALSLEPRVSINRVDLSGGRFTTRLFGSRVDYGFSPRMFASALLQYNSSDSTFSSNLRYRWEYRPGSEFFVVWTDEQDTRPNGLGLRNRAFVLKLTRLLRF